MAYTERGTFKPTTLSPVFLYLSLQVFLKWPKPSNNDAVQECHDLNSPKCLVKGNQKRCVAEFWPFRFIYNM